jgi:hypothetical protein
MSPLRYPVRPPSDLPFSLCDSPLRTSYSVVILVRARAKQVARTPSIAKTHIERIERLLLMLLLQVAQQDFAARDDAKTESSQGSVYTILVHCSILFVHSR